MYGERVWEGVEFSSPWPVSYRCGAACVQVAKFSCDESSNTCSMSDSGPYDNHDDCQRACVPWVQHWSCNEASKQCVKDESGKYSGYSNCFRECNPSVSSRYSCTNGVCTENAAGPYSNEAACAAACSSGDLWVPPSLAPVSHRCTDQSLPRDSAPDNRYS